MINVIGTAGIGKSRLVKELLSSVDDEASVLTGRCLPYGKGITYWPLRDLVRRAAGEVSREGIERLVEGEPDASKVAARIAGAIGIAGSTSAPEETMWAVRRLLERLATDAPLVIAFDDLQWAEPTFLDLIEYLLGWIRDAPILIVCMARPDLLEQHPGWLGAAASASAIVLDPLSEPEAEALLELLSGETELAADLFAQITEAAEGNPLYVEQMLAMLTENGSTPHDLAIPPTIHALLAARLDRLEPEERAVIERAAVIGKEFWRGAIAELTPEEERGSSGTEPHDAGAEGVHRARRLDLSRGGRLPLPPHPDSRRRLPRDPEGDESAAARTLRRLARANRGRARERARRDHRLPPRAGPRVPRGARPRR